MEVNAPSEIFLTKNRTSCLAHCRVVITALLVRHIPLPSNPIRINHFHLLEPQSNVWATPFMKMIFFPLRMMDEFGATKHGYRTDGLAIFHRWKDAKITNFYWQNILIKRFFISVGKYWWFCASWLVSKHWGTDMLIWI